MNGYIAFYNQRRIEIYAASLFEAKQLAVTQFKAPKSKQHMIAVMLAEIEGKPVVHTPDF